MAAARWSADRNRDTDAEPHHPGPGELLPDPRGQRNVRVSGPLDVPPAVSLGEAISLDETLGLAPVSILGPAHTEKGSVGVWRQTHRELPLEIQLVPH